jgi:type IV pilus assembly protein PilW
MSRCHKLLGSLPGCQRGMSMIELLVALAIGGFLIIGAVTLQSNTRKTFTVNEQNARLQETARYVLSVIEPEIQLAGIYGYSNNPTTVKLVLGDEEFYASDLRQSKPPPDDIPGTFNACGENFVVDVAQTVQADDNTYTLDCAASGGGHNAVSDTLTLRRAGLFDVPATGTSLQLFTNRKIPMDQRLFIGAAPPGYSGAMVEEEKEIRDMVIQTYYVSRNADSRPGMPALRLKRFVDGPGWDDQEVIRGVEDIQVEFGVDPGADDNGDGLPDDLANDGMADIVNGEALRYVPPDDAVVLSGQVVAVRIWVRVRAEQEEPGFNDTRVYNYGSTNFEANDRFRRVLMSRTIFLRNTRAFTG